MSSTVEQSAAEALTLSLPNPGQMNCLQPLYGLIRFCMPRVLPIACLWIALAGAGSGEETNGAPPNPASAVSNLIQQLVETPTAVQPREQLLAQPEHVLDYLEQHWNELSATARGVLLRLRPELETRLVAERAAGVQLEFSAGESIATALKRLQQSGIPVEQQLPVEMLSEPLELSSGSHTAWEVLESITRQTSHQLQWTSSGSLQLVAGTEPAPLFETVSGCCRIVVLKVATREDLTTTPAGQLLRISLQAELEPTIRPLSLRISDQDWQVHWQGQPLVHFNNAATRELHFEGSGRVNWTIDFRAPTEFTSTGSCRLEGQGLLRAAFRPVWIRFPADLERRVPFFKTGGQTIELLAWETMAGAGEQRILLEVRHAAAGLELESYRVAELLRQAILQSEHSRTLPVAAEILLEDPLRQRVQYRFLSPVHPGDEFVFRAATLIREIPVSFPDAEFEVQLAP